MTVAWLANVSLPTFFTLRRGMSRCNRRKTRCKALMVIAVLELMGQFHERALASSASAVQRNATIGTGINSISHNLELTKPIDAAARQALAEHFRNVAGAGFQSVRFALPAFQYMNADDRLDPQWVSWLDARVNAALDAGLVVIIDEHDSSFCSQTVLVCQRRLDAYWRQIAPHFANASPRLLFEILNEPHGQMTNTIWNRQIANSLKIIRATNPHRTVVVGPGQWNAIHALSDLQLPESDRNIIVSLHYYDPFQFTHQSAFWIPQTKYISNKHWGSDADYTALAADFATIAQWSTDHHRPINIGEFGAYMKAPLVDRSAWIRAVVHASQSHGFSLNFWPFSFDGDETDITVLRSSWGGADIMKALGK